MEYLNSERCLIACRIGDGNNERFVELMRRRAHELGIEVPPEVEPVFSELTRMFAMAPQPFTARHCPSSFSQTINPDQYEDPNNRHRIRTGSSRFALYGFLRHGNDNRDCKRTPWPSMSKNEKVHSTTKKYSQHATAEARGGGLKKGKRDPGMNRFWCDLIMVCPCYLYSDLSAMSEMQRQTFVR